MPQSSLHYRRSCRHTASRCAARVNPNRRIATAVSCRPPCRHDVLSGVFSVSWTSFAFVSIQSTSILVSVRPQCAPLPPDIANQRTDLSSKHAVGQNQAEVQSTPARPRKPRFENNSSSVVGLGLPAIPPPNSWEEKFLRCCNQAVEVASG